MAHAFAAQLYAALSSCDPADKCRQVAALCPPQTALCEPLALAEDALAAIPGRPTAPALVHPARVKSRGLGSVENRAVFIHAIAHIEFNAINLALDAALRFRGMPLAFYVDWVSVAQDEARHFQLLQQRLQALGHRYGDFPAHNGLWEAAEKTRHDVLVRMALVPRVLEARGLDVTPGLIDKLMAHGDAETAAVLRVILHEEVRHVAIGSHWFRHCCQQRGCEPEATFVRLLQEYGMRLRPPFNRQARLQAGFSPNELEAGLSAAPV